MMQKWIKTLGILILVIIICSVSARLLSGGQTLSDYAGQNPEIAYATPEKTELPQPEESPSPEPEAASPAAEENTAREDVPPAEAAPSSAPFEVTVSEERTTYKEGFFYQPLTDDVTARITGISYPVSEVVAPALALDATNIVSEEDARSLAVSYEDLRYMNVLYYDFSGEVQTGELICSRSIAQDLAEIFYELYRNEYQIEKIRLIDEYGGDDTASMLDNNTSCFNYRVVDGTDSLSKHAIGCAIDINPFYNPYVVFNKDGSGETYISPEGSEIYADRSLNFPYKIDENDLCCKLFKAHGFTWGGDWNSCKDYQHFQKTPKS